MSFSGKKGMRSENIRVIGISASRVGCEKEETAWQKTLQRQM